MKMRARYALPLIALLAISSITVVYAAVTITLTATSGVTVTPPKVSAMFVSGSLSNEVSLNPVTLLANGFAGERCTVGGAGATITCPNFSIQSGDYVVFTATVRNTGTDTVAVSISATPANPSVLTITPESPQTYIFAGGNATYLFSIDAISPGASGFSVTLFATGQ